jgi:hypothetical protein
MRSTRPCFNEEAALTSGFTKKETTAGSIPEAAAAYQEWASKQMELFSRQAKKVFEERRISPRPAARSLAMARGRPVHDRRKAASCDGDQESQISSQRGESVHVRGESSESGPGVSLQHRTPNDLIRKLRWTGMEAHGVIGLTKVVALETATTGITCNAICPGWVLTPLVEKQIRDRAAHENISVDRAKIKLLSEKQPSHEFATPEQIGALTVFLCSNAAAQIRGAALPVDGGWTAQ